jgi:hypothetical protein
MCTSTREDREVDVLLSEYCANEVSQSRQLDADLFAEPLRPNQHDLRAAIARHPSDRPAEGEPWKTST